MLFQPTAEEVAKITGKPILNVRVSLPEIYSAMQSKAVRDIPSVVATLATVATECPFLPIDEYGGRDYFFKMYDKDSPDPNRRKVAAALGNTQPGDGNRFHGRGFVQLTGRANYQKYSTPGLDLVARPEMAKEPHIAALILVRFLHEHGVYTWAARGNWLKVRKLVNGGTNGWDYFGGVKGVVWKFLDLAHAKK